MVKIFINKIDVKERYGIILSSGGFSALRKPSPMKQYIESKSRLEHGKRVIVKNPKVDERSLVLPILLIANSMTDFTTKYDQFCTEILETGKLEIQVDTNPDIIYRCIYEDCQQYTEYVGEMAKFMLKLTEPNPKNRGKVSV